MVAYTYRMPAGIPGSTNRDWHSTIVPEIVLATNPPTAYGIPVMRDAATGKMRPAGAGDTAALIAGILVRPFPHVGSALTNDVLGGGTPPVSGICNVLVRGYVDVVCNGNTVPAKGGVVYLRIANASAGKPIGGIEAAADSTNTIVVPNCTWMGPPDAQGNTEIAYNI